MNPLVCTRCGARVPPAAPLVCHGSAATLEPVELLDTTERSIEETADAVCAWLAGRG